LPVRGRRPLDRMELQLLGPCSRTCSSSTASSSGVQVPFRTASPPLPAALLPRAARRRAPLGARAIALPRAAQQQSEAMTSWGSGPKKRCSLLLTGAGHGREWCVWRVEERWTGIRRTGLIDQLKPREEGARVLERAHEHARVTARVTPRPPISVAVSGRLATTRHIVLRMFFLQVASGQIFRCWVAARSRIINPSSHRIWKYI
jgi:hypothetical protein